MCMRRKDKPLGGIVLDRGRTNVSGKVWQHLTFPRSLTGEGPWVADDDLAFVSPGLACDHVAVLDWWLSLGGEARLQLVFQRETQA
jgi:hypothetical protein